jgi:hypothetical protein
VVVTGLLALALVMVPVGPSPRLVNAAPRAVTVTAFNPAGATLVQTIRDPLGVARLATDLDRLTPLVLMDRFACRHDNGSYYRAVLSYANGDRVTADVRRTGCEQVSFGASWPADRLYTDPQLLSDLDALFPPDWQTGF